jgi:hypothetical protein
MTVSARCLLSLILGAVFLSACASAPPGKADSSASSSSSGRVGPGMNADGEVINSAKVEHATGRP